MSRLPPLAAVAALSVLAASPAFAEVIWKGDFSTGDLSQWTKAQKVSDDRLQLIDDGGQPALRVHVEQGDDPINASGNRNELVYTGDPASEAERWYGWSTLWPEDYASVAGWQLFTQFHHDGLNGSPPVELFVNGEELKMRVNSVDVWTAPLERGRWHDFVLHVKWSSDPGKGFVELMYDGGTVVPLANVATLFAGEGVYLKQGLYRDADIAPAQTVFHRGMTIATAYGDLAGASTAAGGQPSGDGAPAPLTQPSGEGPAGASASCSSTGVGGLAGIAAALALSFRQQLGRRLSSRVSS